jgi:hypothetical protein
MQVPENMWKPQCFYGTQCKLVKKFPGALLLCRLIIVLEKNSPFDSAHGCRKIISRPRINLFLEMAGGN